MTTRQQQIPGSEIAPSANGADIGAERAALFSWEDWFCQASSPQRAEALGLARQQGFLYPQQLPPLRNIAKSVPATKELDAPSAIVGLLSGKADGLAPLQLDALTYFDAELDDLQRQAVARALGTPDLLLLQGLPGTGKSRVLKEILLQAAARGWRTLFLAGQTASLDVVLQHLSDRPEVFALRFLDVGENSEALPACLRRFTLDEQKQALLERVRAGARDNHEQAEAICKQRQSEESLWNELQICAERHGNLETKLTVLHAQLPGPATAIEDEPDSADAPLRARMTQMKQAYDQAFCALEARLGAELDALVKCEQVIGELAARLAEQAPAYHAKKHGRFWTFAYWTNRFNDSIIKETEGLQDQLAQAKANQQRSVKQIEALSNEKNHTLEQFERARAKCLEDEIQARRHSLRNELVGFEAAWTDLCCRIGADIADKTPEAIAAAHDAWQKQKTSDQQQCLFTQQWAEFVEQAGASLAAKLPSFATVLLGTVMRWHTDAKFRDAAAGPFDLLIVEDAEALTEADLLKLARQASRCVLVGQALGEQTPAPTPGEKAARALLPAPLVSTACWNKLWQTLGGDAGRGPCSWRREEGRLVCQLTPLSVEDRQHLESEGLADAPDIELRILHRPGSRPCLAEVIFARHCSFAEAFIFMVREVQEFPLEPLGRTGWWSEDAQRHCRHLGPSTARIDAWLEIELGVRLGTVVDRCGDATRAVCLEFDKTAGWDRDKAAAWLYRHRAVRDHERTIFLQSPYRFQGPLAQIVQAIVPISDWLTTGIPKETTGDKSLEFVPVPPLTKHEWPREGAGLELDLTASRHADRLPVGLRQSLPPRGFVNYLEAQALIRRLEAWQRTDAAASCSVAVLALYEGQVELLRRLVEQSEILRARAFPLEVALPSRMHQRECDVVFLSLTRSHAHRSVAFGGDIKEFPLALTRARSRLIVFGDPGSLCKRTSWTGPLDHLDAASAEQELQRVSCLAANLQKQGQGLPTANGLAHGTG